MCHREGADAMVDGILWDDVVCIFLAGNFSPQKTKVSDPPLTDGQT